MSRFTGSEYRGPRDRSRSPPRFPDRRVSAANIFDSRPSGPHRNGPDAPRGPRSQLDPPARGPPPPSSSGPGNNLGTGVPPPRALRDAPPLQSGDRPRTFREYDRRDRPPSPRERSPPRGFNIPPRDIEAGRPRRLSREGPAPAGSSYPDSPFASAPFRGGFGRGRGRGDFDYRGGRAPPRRPIDDRERDLFRRERSPPPRYGRDLSRDSRDADRRDERRFDRRDDDRRPDWTDRERELDRSRRDPLLPPGRVDSRPPADGGPNAVAPHVASIAPPINPDRLAMLESTGADTTLRRPSAAALPPSLRDSRRDIPLETPPYLNGRAETTANRYGSRGSSPPTQAPPVPAFSFYVASTPTPTPPVQPQKPAVETKPVPTDDRSGAPEPKPTSEEKPAPPPNAPTAPAAKAPPPAPKSYMTSPLLSAPKAPRALETTDSIIPTTNRAQASKSLENTSGNNQGITTGVRTDTNGQSPAVPSSPGSTRQSFPHLSQPISPNLPQGPRFGDLAAAPTGPRATRASPAQSSVSPRPPFASSPRADFGTFPPAAVSQRAQTPPPSAPSGPRRQSFSVSPGATHPSVPSVVPTAPRGTRAPVAPRAAPNSFSAQNRPPDRPANAPPPTAPSGPRGQQWNQWKQWQRPFIYNKPIPAIPAKRDSNGDEKDKASHSASSLADRRNSTSDAPADIESHEESRAQIGAGRYPLENSDQMDIDKDQPNRKLTPSDNHSAAQSFFGKQLDEPDDEVDSSSEDDELDEDEDATLLEAKHARKERELRSRMIDLSSRDYRATTPLESIARLARLSFKDLQRLGERNQDMDVDDPEVDALHLGPHAAQSSESDDGPDVLTPNGDESKPVAIRDHDMVHDGQRRVWKRSPSMIALRYLVKPEDVSPLEASDMYIDNVKRLEAAEPDMLAALHEEVEAEEILDDEVESEFEILYRQWREDCEELDRLREEQERLERQQSQEPGPEIEGPALVPSNPIIEGRRILKFSSEYEFKQVLKQSEETARIEQERLEREAKKVQADMEKEAWLPDQLPDEIIVQRTMIDANGFRKPEALTLVFSYEPPADNFTEGEQSIFIAAFKDTPKKWGEIASLLPDRTYKDCIHHYYANKWDGRFRDNRAKKLKGGRRGRGGKSSRPTRGSALMADLNRNEDLLTAPNVSDSGRPKRAAAPTTFGEKDPEQKAAIMGTSPAKKSNQSKNEANSETGSDGRAKRQKRAGEKAGRKAKNQLTAIAAAPTALSPGKPTVHGVQPKEMHMHAQDLADASLLASLQNGHVLQPVFTQERLPPQPMTVEEQERAKPSAAPKTGASSYWSGPERADFLKYIAHFGTDFAAIAAHMGTKTQIMIKNHYQRSVDHGGIPDLQESAMLANARRERGEDLGTPPAPTPIVKRKYENPQTTAPRVIAPQTEAMEIDDHNSPSIPAVTKHASPPQFQTKPRFVSSSAASTPIQTPHVVPSPVPTTIVPLSGPTSTAPHGQHVHSHVPPPYLNEPHVDPRPGIQQQSLHRIGPELPVAPPARSQPLPPQPSHAGMDSQYIHNLEQERDKAMMLQRQAEYSNPEYAKPEQRVDRHHVPLQHLSTHTIPASQTTPIPVLDRKPPPEEKTPTPPRGPSAGGSTLTHPLFGLGSSMAKPSFAPLSSRGSYNPSPPKADISRPASVMNIPSQPPPAPAPLPVPEPPKRSNLASILNETEEQRPAPKHEPLPGVPTRTSSPAYRPSTPQGSSSSTRRDPFSQPPFHRPHYSQAPPTPAAVPPTLKHEPLSAGSSTAPGWASHFGPRETPRAPSSSQPYYHTPSLLSRHNPSPPPHTASSHSRVPSFAGSATGPQQRDQRPLMGGMQQGPSHPVPPALHHNPYRPPTTPYSQAPMSMNRAAHSHNSSMSEGMQTYRHMHNSSRGPGESARREEDFARERAESEYRMPMYADRQAEYQAAQRQDQEYERRQHGVPPPLSRPPPPIQPQAGQAPFNPQIRHGMVTRDPSMREYESATQEERRFREDIEQRHYRETQHPPALPPQFYNMRNDREPSLHRPPVESYRQPEESFSRRTPLGGPAYAPPPPPGPRHR